MKIVKNQILLNLKYVVFIYFILLYCSFEIKAQETYNWEPAKIGGGGYVTGLIAHPAEQNLVYCRTDVGGLYRWNNAENKWVQLITYDRMPLEVLNAPDINVGAGMGRTAVYPIESFAIDHNNANILYVAAGNSYTNPGFFLKSYDKGENFVKLSFEIPCGGNRDDRMSGERLAVDPNNSQVVYFGSRNQGLWRSLDGGQSFSQISLTQMPLGVKTGNSAIGNLVVVVDPSGGTISGRSKRVYTTVEGRGVYTSNDGGDTWSQIQTTSYALDMQVVGGVLYYAAKTEGVKKYTPTGGVVSISPNTKIVDIAVDINNNQRLYAVDQGFGNCYRSINGGTNWVRLGTNTGSETSRAYFQSDNTGGWKEKTDVVKFLSIGEILIDPFNSSKMWFAEGMGMWRSDNIGDTQNTPTFNDISMGIEEMVSTDITSTGNGNFVVTVWDRIGFYFNTASQYPTEPLKGLSLDFSDGGSVATAPDDPQFVVANVSDHRGCCGNGTYSGYSEDGGKTWTKFASITGMNNNPANLKFGEIEISAVNHSNMVWCPRNNENKIYYTKDKGATWQAATLPSGYSNSNLYYLTSKRVLAADPVTSGTFYLQSWGNVGSDPYNPVSPSHFLRSTDGGATWTDLSTALPYRSFNSQLRAVPGKSKTLWFTPGYDHREPLDKNGIFTTTDGGQNWTKMPNVEYCYALGFGAKKDANQTFPTAFMYGHTAANGWGIYRSTDNGASWKLISSYPLGLFDRVQVIEGDVSEFGKIYIGFTGNSFVVGSISDTVIHVEAVKIKPKTIEMFASTTYQLQKFIVPDNATNKNVTWTSSNTAIATVDSKGLVTAKSAGTVNITVKTEDQNKTDVCVVTVKNIIQVESVNLSPASKTLGINETLQLSAEVLPVNASIKDVTYSSSNTSIATVSATGLVTGKYKGTATITVTTKDQSKTDNCIITVSPADNALALINFDDLKPTVQTQTAGLDQMYGSNGTVSIVDNPGKSTENQSNLVGKFVKNAANWALVGFNLDKPRNLSDFTSISVQFYGTMSEVFIQLKNATGTVLFDMTKTVSVTNSWQTIDFTFPSQITQDLKNICIYPNPNAATSATFYVDNIKLVYGTIPPDKPLAPSNLLASVISSSQINLSWTDNSTNEDGFYIDRKQGTGAYTQIASVGANVKTYSNTGLSTSTTYTYRVRAYNIAGDAASNEISATTNGVTPPTAPSGLTATAISSSQINLSWTDNSSNEDGFYIDRKQGTGTFTQIASVGANVKTYSNTGLISSTTYTYRVRAYNGGGDAASNEISATTQTESIVFQQSTSSDGVVAMEAENFSYKFAGKNTFAGTNWTEYADANCSNGKYMMVPNANKNGGTSLDAPYMDYKINFVKTGTHYIWIRHLSIDANSNSVTPRYNGNLIFEWHTNTSTTWNWLEAGTTFVAATGEQTFSLYNREDGMKIDKIIITTNSSLNPTGMGQTETKDYTIDFPLTTLNTSNDDLLTIYPNPFAQKLNIDFKINEIFDIKIHAPNGMLIFQEKDVWNNICVDLSNYAAGVYSIILSNNNTFIRKKVVKY